MSFYFVSIALGSLQFGVPFVLVGVVLSGQVLASSTLVRIRTESSVRLRDNGEVQEYSSQTKTQLTDTKGTPFGVPFVLVGVVPSGQVLASSTLVRIRTFYLHTWE